MVRRLLRIRRRIVELGRTTKWQDRGNIIHKIEVGIRSVHCRFPEAGKIDFHNDTVQAAEEMDAIVERARTCERESRIAKWHQDLEDDAKAMKWIKKDYDTTNPMIQIDQQ